MGGPKSEFYAGKFAEVACRLDDISPNHTLSQIIDIVENKDLGQYASQSVSFDKTPSLTPAFWLKVDKKWKNTQK